MGLEEPGSRSRPGQDSAYGQAQPGGVWGRRKDQLCLGTEQRQPFQDALCGHYVFVLL